MHAHAPADDDVVVLISAIEHYSYCPRQCALIHVEQTYDENVFTLRGKLAHERVDSGDGSRQRGVITERAIPLWSERYGLLGTADVVEWHDGVPYPVEHKVGKRHRTHADLQLCAQALCLEEMLGVEVPRGAIYSGSSRKRHEVIFTTALRQHAIDIIAAIRTQMVQHHIPDAPNDERCRNCSLKRVCLPQVLGNRARLRGLQHYLFTPLAEGAW